MLTTPTRKVMRFAIVHDRHGKVVDARTVDPVYDYELSYMAGAMEPGDTLTLGERQRLSSSERQEIVEAAKQDAIAKLKAQLAELDPPPVEADA